MPDTEIREVKLLLENASDIPSEHQKYLWVEHTTVKVDQQGQIISRMRADKVIDTGVGKRETVGVNVKQVEEVASKVKVNLGLGMMAQGTNLSKQEIKKFEEYLSLFCSSSTRRDPGLYHAVSTAGCGTHEEPCNGCLTVPVD